MLGTMEIYSSPPLFFRINIHKKKYTPRDSAGGVMTKKSVQVRVIAQGTWRHTALGKKFF